MITDQVSPRQGAIWEATFGYQQLVSQEKRDNEGLEFLESVRPDIADFSVLPPDEQGTAMQWAAIMLAHQAYGPEASKERFSKFKANMDASGAKWQNSNEEFAVTALMLNGDIDTAIDVALEESLSKPVSEWIARNSVYRLPFFDSVTSDPRVVARLAERDRELEEAKREVIAMMQGEEWQ